MRRVIVFDVNETLLSLDPIRGEFATRFGNADLADRWFATLLRSSLVANIVGEHRDFAELAGAAFEMAVAARGEASSTADRAAVLSAMRSLPAHPDVEPGLTRLAEAGFRLAALTNSPPSVVGDQLGNAGLTRYFDKVLTVETVGRFKPDGAVYRTAAADLGVPPERLRMVAAHDWDVYGAMRAGCAAAFVARPGMALSPLQPVPDVVGPDLTTVAARIVAIDT